MSPVPGSLGFENSVLEAVPAREPVGERAVVAHHDQRRAGFGLQVEQQFERVLELDRKSVV